MKIERRFIITDRTERSAHLAPELRAGVGGQPAIVGYAAMFDSPTAIREGGGTFNEVIRPGAFDEYLRSGGDTLGLFNHNIDMLLGRRSSGTLKLSVDSTGLRYEITPPPTQLGRDLTELIRRGDVKGSSFAFSITSAGERWSILPGDPLPLREVINVANLFDVSPVTSPAYPDTTAGLGSASSGPRQSNETFLDAVNARLRVLEIDADNDKDRRNIPDYVAATLRVAELMEAI
jgi:uncharacterized protein